MRVFSNYSKEYIHNIYATSAFRKMPMFPCWKSRLHSPTVIRFHAVVRPNLRNYWKIQIIIAYYLGTLSVQTLIYWYRNWNRKLKLKRKQKQKTETEAVPEAEARPDCPDWNPVCGEGRGGRDRVAEIPRNLFRYPSDNRAARHKLIANLHYLLWKPRLDIFI